MTTAIRSYREGTHPRTALAAGTVAAAVLSLLVLASGCTSQQESPTSKSQEPGLPSSLLGAGPVGQPRLSSGPRRSVLPQYLAGHPAITSRLPSHAGSADESATPGDRDCPDQVRGLLRAISEGQSFAPPAATTPKVQARAYGPAGHPVLWAVTLEGGGSSSRDQPGFLRGASRRLGCLGVDSVFDAGGIRVSAARLPTHAFDPVRLLRARLEGDTVIVACAVPVQDTSCRGAMLELVHFLGL